jgi:hypothetical protein
MTGFDIAWALIVFGVVVGFMLLWIWAGRAER